MPELSIWNSVDKMSDKTPDVSSYAYCINNPIVIIDPDGNDWFFNEITGAVYYNSKMGAKEAGTGTMTGEGWKHLGKNDMFKKTDNIALAGNKELADGGVVKYNPMYNSNSPIPSNEAAQVTGYSTEAMFSGENAKTFMENMDYKIVPSEVTVTSDISEHPSVETGPRGSVTITTGTEITVGNKCTYVPDSYVETARFNTKHSYHNTSYNIITGIHRTKEQYTENIKYGPKSAKYYFGFLWNLAQSTSGNLDYVDRYSRNKF